jgi:hypothetical protein
MLKYLPLKQKFGVCVICVSLFSGCAGPTRSYVSGNDLLYYQRNCAEKDGQLAYLESLRPTTSEKVMASLQVQTLGKFSSEYENNYLIARGIKEQLINDAQRHIRQTCIN